LRHSCGLQPLRTSNRRILLQYSSCPYKAILFGFPTGIIVTPLFNTLLHVIRYIGVKLHIFSCRRMCKSQGLGMQGLTWQNFKAVFHKLLVLCKSRSFQNLVASITLVIKQSMPYMLEVGSDLVSPSGFKPALN